MVMLMGKLWKTFLPSSSSVEFIESCSLPYIKKPDSKSLRTDCFIDIFYVLDGMVELMFNIPPSKTLSSGHFIFLHGKNTDCFIISGGKDSNVLHARIIPCDLYKDLILYHRHYNSLCVLNEDNSHTLPAAGEMIKLLLNMKKVKSGTALSLESPVALFFVHLYLNEISDSSLLFNAPGHQLSKLMLEIIKKPGYSWHVKDMAKEYCMSTNFFISEFRKISGFTPFNFLKKIRLNKGKQLLENTDAPVSVIARQCGYNSHASFAFYMKKEFGIPPFRIRKNAKINNDIAMSEDKCKQ